MIDAGIERVVIGSLALSNPDLFGRIVDAVGPNRITLALDVRIEDGNPMVATHGWLRGSDQSLYDVLSRFGAVRHLLVTDIAKDGMLAGPNVALMSALVERYPEIALQASGGVAKLGDLDALRNAGAARAIVGKAIWERRFSVGEGIAHASG
jgi:phosphoribosylformimino-5-aminoimidazole carboxamide ribotide isomerase